MGGEDGAAGFVGDASSEELAADLVFEFPSVFAECDSLSYLVAEIPHLLGGDVGGGEKSGAEEVGEDRRVDLVGFDFGFRDHAGFEWVCEDHAVTRVFERLEHGFPVGAGLYCDGELGEFFEEVLDLVWFIGDFSFFYGFAVGCVYAGLTGCFMDV